VTFDVLSTWVTSSLLLGLRIAPVFAFAPPFTLIRIPRLFRLLFGLGLAACMVAVLPASVSLGDISLATLVSAAVRELMLGAMFVLAFQLVFAALYMAGRTIDIQAGFGLAMLIDPNTRGQTPLVGTLFAYAAAALFFALDGHADLLRILSASLEAIPLGTWTLPGSLGRLSAFMSAVFLMGFGAAGTAILALFLVDMVIALLSRTVPQMNVLIMGFQVKTIVLLLVLPVCFGAGGALLVRMMRITLEALPGLL
jgi:flagellar biosynthetic protein FliR